MIRTATLVAGCVVAASAGPTSYKKQNPGEARSYDCPKGYDLQGKTCITKEVHPESFICPAGTQEVNGQCTSFSALLKQCPTGFQSAGKQCSRPINQPASPFCQDDFVLTGNTCEKFVPVPAFCPQGYSQDKNGCAQYTATLSECPVGFTRSGKGCTKTNTFPRIPTCSAEYTLENNQCTKYVPIPAFCPSGFQQDKNGCAQYTGKLSECPVGFTRSAKGKCIKTNTFPKVPTCSKEYTLEGNQCVKHVPVPSFCPSGYQQSKDGCAQFTNKLSQCPTGFTQSHKGCKKSVPVPRIPQCPSGFELEKNVCKQIVNQPGYTVCNVGVKQGDQCVTTQSAQKQYVCQKGYLLQGSSCVTQETYDCSTTVFDTVCTQQAVAPMNGKKGWLRSLGKKGKKHSPVTYAKKAPQPICNQVPRHIQKTCTKNNQVPAQSICPPGFTMNGKSCTQTISQPAQFIQPEPRIITQAPSMVCPAGGCSITETAALNFFCPNGFFDSGDRCLKTADLVQPAPRRVAVAASMICTGGNGPSCVDTEEAALNYFCPSGYTDAGDRCLKMADLIQPAPRRVAIAPNMICSAGQGSSCAETETAPLNYFCRTGYTEAGDRCLKTAQLIQPAPRSVTVPTQYQCANGFTLSGRMCITTETVSFDEYCANGFQRMGDRCAKFAEHLSVCRIGQKSHEGCVVTKSAPAQVTIVRTCTKGEKGC